MWAWVFQFTTAIQSILLHFPNRKSCTSILFEFRWNIVNWKTSDDYVFVLLANNTMHRLFNSCCLAFSHALIQNIFAQNCVAWWRTKFTQWKFINFFLNIHSLKHLFISTCIHSRVFMQIFVSKMCFEAKNFPVKKSVLRRKFSCQKSVSRRKF